MVMRDCWGGPSENFGKVTEWLFVGVKLQISLHLKSRHSNGLKCPLTHKRVYFFGSRLSGGKWSFYRFLWNFQIPPHNIIQKPYSEVCPINWNKIQNMKQHKWNDMDKQSVIGCLWSISESWADRTGAFYVYNHVLRQPSVTTVALNHDNMIIATHVTTQWNNYHLI